MIDIISTSPPERSLLVPEIKWQKFTLPNAGKMSSKESEEYETALLNLLKKSIISPNRIPKSKMKERILKRFNDFKKQKSLKNKKKRINKRKKKR